MRIALLIRSLEYGGAEQQTCLLAESLQSLGHDVTVLTFYPGGALASNLQRSHIRHVSLDKRSRWDLLGFFLRLLLWLRRNPIDTLYSFMPTANIVALCAKTLRPSLAVIWGIRASPPDAGHYDRTTMLTYTLQTRLARFPNRIISNSHAGTEPFRRAGTPARQLVVIPNGVDTHRFRPDAMARQEIRKSWNIRSDQNLVGIVARIDPMKDHRTFLSAAQRVHEALPETQFAIIGHGDPALVDELKQLSRALGIADKILWAGTRADMPSVYNALDLLVLSSAFGEGFPNVLAEAQACGTPCLATDVGDSRFVLGEDDRIVQPHDAVALAAGAIEMLRHKAATPADRCRRHDRIVLNFSAAKMVERTVEVLSIASRKPAGISG